jgi:hypothetical protein
MRVMRYLVALLVLAGAGVAAYWYFFASGEQLRYNVKPGQVYTYKYAVNADGTIASQGMPTPVPLSISGTVVSRLKVLGVKPDGTFTANWRLVSVSSRATAMGIKQQMPIDAGEAAKGGLTLTVKPNGEFAAPLASSANLGILGDVASAKTLGGVLGLGASYPSHPVRVGRSWKGDPGSIAAALTRQGGVKPQDLSVEQSYRLAKVEDMGGRKVATIEGRTTITHKGGEDGKGGAKVRALQRVRVFLDTGMPASGTSSGNVQVSAAGGQGDISLKLSGTLSRVAAAAPKKASARR